MSNALRKEAFAPRSHLQRTLKYRPHLKWAYYSLLAVAPVFWVSAVLITVAELSKGSAAQNSGSLVLSSFLALVMYLEARFLLKPLAFSTVHVFNDHLEIDRMGKQIHVPFDDVKEIQFRYLPYSGGWFKLCTSGASYKFTLVLERSEYILEAVAAYNPQLVPADKLEAFRRTAVTSDHSLAHLYDGLKDKRSLLWKFAGLPIAAAIVLRAVSFFQGNPFVFMNLVSTIVVLLFFQLAAAMLGNWIISLVLTFKTRKALIENPNRLQRDREFEKRMEFVNQTVQKILFTCAVVAIFASILSK
jgi:hypothetical protein